MKNIHIENSYKIWRPRIMEFQILTTADIYFVVAVLFDKRFIKKLLRGCLKEKYNRSIYTMYIEWWLHNIGYYLTLPFCWIKKFKSWNERCKHVDLEEWK